MEQRKDQLFDDLMWKAVQDRDRSRDGEFFYGVVTTGVYCRPSCAARRPQRKNVRFFRDAAEAERAGLRACLRCRPLATTGVAPEAVRMRKVCDYIRAHAEQEEGLTLARLATVAGISPFHFQRAFKAMVGVTPRQFVEACRLRSLKKELRKSPSVTDAIYEAGFGSSSRVYERADTRLGMTPAEYRAGGKGLAISYVAVDSALGRVMIAATDRGLCFVQFAEHDDELVAMLRTEYPTADIGPMREPYPEQFGQWMNALQEHLAGQQPRLDLPLDLRATAFQMKVWRYLQSIPYGGVQSYSEVAAGVGAPSASRAVAQACAANRVALVIPCHRVIRNSGALGGYRWGIERKRTLIDQERRMVAAQGPSTSSKTPLKPESGLSGPPVLKKTLRGHEKRQSGVSTSCLIPSFH
jgi:AraC family transcriptional regulator, regulatory protein of adaptative response / methylated-DNA-[protein]-cysteine methyltransferase